MLTLRRYDVKIYLRFMIGRTLVKLWPSKVILRLSLLAGTRTCCPVENIMLDNCFFGGFGFLSLILILDTINSTILPFSPHWTVSISCWLYILSCGHNIVGYNSNELGWAKCILASSSQSSWLLSHYRHYSCFFFSHINMWLVITLDHLVATRNILFYLYKV